MKIDEAISVLTVLANSDMVRISPHIPRGVQEAAKKRCVAFNVSIAAMAVLEGKTEVITSDQITEIFGKTVPIDAVLWMMRTNHLATNDERYLDVLRRFKKDFDKENTVEQTAEHTS